MPARFSAPRREPNRELPRRGRRREHEQPGIRHGSGAGVLGRGQRIRLEKILHDLRDDEQILILPNARPIRCGRAIYFRRDEMLSLVKQSTFA